MDQAKRPQSNLTDTTTREILVGTGFHASSDNERERVKFFLDIWLSNTWKASSLVHVVHNADCLGLGRFDGCNITHITNNLGHNCLRSTIYSRIMGWSMSWIIPALVAYSENCDFIYKEQDCLAFGDWLPVVRGNGNGFRCGKFSRMEAEQSLFFLERDFIPDFVAAYMSFPASDSNHLPESKGPAAARACGLTDFYFDMPFGRDRPLTFYTDRPWYAQRFSAEELAQVKEAGLI